MAYQYQDPNPYVSQSGLSKAQSSFAQGTGIQAPTLQQSDYQPTHDTGPGGMQDFNPNSAVTDYQNQAAQLQYKGQLASAAKGAGDKSMFTSLGGQVDPNDPWGFYRESMGTQLAASQKAGDPSNVYRDKLQQMSTGQFGIDDPSYKFRLEQGQQALERSQASKGLLGSGNAALELQDYGQKSASTEYAAQFGRLLQGMQGVESQYGQQQSRLMEMAGVNLNPATSGSQAIQSQGQALQAGGQAASLRQSGQQWQDQLNMNQQYQQGLASTQPQADPFNINSTNSKYWTGN